MNKKSGTSKEAADKLVRGCENIGVFCKEAENQPRHEVVHIVAAFSSAPFGIILEQLNIEAVQTTCRLISNELSRICLTVLIPAKGRKKPK